MEISETPAAAEEVEAPMRGRHDKEGRRRALLDAATCVFSERGYDAATTREIAERAACSEGLIHRYFGGKEGLLSAVIELRARLVASDVVANLPEQASLADELHAFMDWELDRMWRDRDSMRVSISRCVIDPAVGREIGQLFHRVRSQSLKERLEWHQSQGHIPEGVDLLPIAEMISGLAFNAGFFGQVALELDRDSLRAGAHAIAEILASGLASASATPGRAADGNE